MVQDGFLLQGPASWLGKYYKYRVKVYSPWSQRIETLEATDPYSRSLAADGARTQVCPDGTSLLRASPVLGLLLHMCVMLGPCILPQVPHRATSGACPQ